MISKTIGFRDTLFPDTHGVKHIFVVEVFVVDMLQGLGIFLGEIIAESSGIHHAEYPMTDPWCCYIWIYMVTFTINIINIPQMLAYIYIYISAPWIRHGYYRLIWCKPEMSDGFCQVSILSHSKDIPPQPSRFGRAVAWCSQELQKLQVKDVKAGDCWDVCWCLLSFPVGQSFKMTGKNPARHLWSPVMRLSGVVGLTKFCWVATWWWCTVRIFGCSQGHDLALSENVVYTPKYPMVNDHYPY